jgi:hypothetical protein
VEWLWIGCVEWLCDEQALEKSKSSLGDAPPTVDERSQVNSHIVERVIGVFAPRLKPLRARRELALRDIWIGHGFQ